MKVFELFNAVFELSQRNDAESAWNYVEKFQTQNVQIRERYTLFTHCYMSASDKAMLFFFREEPLFAIYKCISWEFRQKLQSAVKDNAKSAMWT